MTPNEKIDCVLKKIKEQIDLVSKSKMEKGDGFWLIKNDVLSSCDINYYELKNILEKIKEEGFLTEWDKSFEGLGNNIKILPSRNFISLYDNSSYKADEGISTKKEENFAIICALLNKQYEDKDIYFSDPFSEKARSWFSRTKQLIAKVDYGMSKRFSTTASKYEVIKSLPLRSQDVKEAVIKQVTNKILKEILEAKEYLMLSDEKIEEIKLDKIYSAGDPFAFIIDIVSLIKEVKKEIFIVDPYINDEIFIFFVSNLTGKNEIGIRILLNKAKSTLSGKTIDAFKESNNNIKLEVRDSMQIHDRYIFIDDRGWVIGQSVKDGAKNKPTYIIELIKVKENRGLHEDIWGKSPQF